MYNDDIYEDAMDILDNASLGVHLVGSDGTILWANKDELSLLGYTKEEYIGHNITEFHACQDTINDILQRLTGNETLSNYEAKIIAKDGTIKVVQINSSVFFKDGKFVHTRCFTRDITELKKMQAEAEEKRRLEEIQKIQQAEAVKLIRAQARAEEAEAHKKRLTDYINMVCHGIRNPMTGIHGNNGFIRADIEFLNHLLQQHPLSIEFKEHLGNRLKDIEEYSKAIGECVAHQKVITDDMLNLSRLEVSQIPKQAVPIKLKDCIHAIAHMFKGQLAAKNLTLFINMSNEDALLKLDAYHLSQIFTNLISNAIKFTPRGHIRLILTIQESSTGTFLHTVIEDTGIGMIKEELSSIFNPFTQGNSKTAKEYGGSGLGLSITKKLVELLGGTIQVESIPGIGTRFSFTVQCEPLTEEEKKSFNEQNSIAELAPIQFGKSRTILLVEDNSINQKILIKYMQDKNLSYAVAKDGLEAIEQWKNNTFELILMDIKLPRLDGIEVTKSIRQQEQTLHRKPIVIVGLSADAMPQQIDEAMQAGMNDYLVKPYNREQLYLKIQQWLEPKAQSSQLSSPSFSSCANLHQQPTFFQAKSTQLERAVVEAVLYLERS